jgi:mRNA-degrading endonuclease RelE of RelBE toxin-antitoxin system
MKDDIIDIHASDISNILVIACRNKVKIYKHSQFLSDLNIPGLLYCAITTQNVLVTGRNGEFSNYSTINCSDVVKNDVCASFYDQATNSVVLFISEGDKDYVVKYDAVNDKDYWRVEIDKIRIISFVKDGVLCIVHKDYQSVTLIDYLKGEVIKRIDKEELGVDAGAIVCTTNDSFIISTPEGFLLLDFRSFRFSFINIIEQLNGTSFSIKDVDPYFFKSYGTDIIYSLSARHFAIMSITEKRLKVLDINSVTCNTSGIKLRIINHARKGNLLYFNASDAMRMLKGGYVGVFDIEQEKIIYLLDAGLGDKKFFPAKSCPTILGDQIYLYDSENNLMEFSIEN